MENNNKITSRGLDALLYIAGFRLFDGGRGQDSPIIVMHNTGISSIIIVRRYKMNNPRLWLWKKIKTVKLLKFLTGTTEKKNVRVLPSAD